MHDDELRALIREAIARHLAEGRGRYRPADVRLRRAAGSPNDPDPIASFRTHASHGRFVFLAPVEPDSPCVVEPHVTCHHCGFCQSYGH